MDQTLSSPINWYLSSLTLHSQPGAQSISIVLTALTALCWWVLVEEEEDKQLIVSTHVIFKHENGWKFPKFKSFLIQDFTKLMWEGYKVIKWVTLHKKQYVTKRISDQQKLYWSSGEWWGRNNLPNFLINCCFFVGVIDCKGGQRIHIIQNIIFYYDFVIGHRS